MPKKTKAGQNVNAQLVSDPKYAPFEGHFRRPVKTSLARQKGKIVPTKTFPDLGALLDSLVPDATMRSDHKLKVRTVAQKKAQQKGATGPLTRFPEELRNVKVTAWMCAVKYESDKGGDNDFHVILSSAPNTSAGSTRFMTSEVSGLPVKGAGTAAGDKAVLDPTSPDFKTLTNARQQLVDFFPQQKLVSTFFKLPKATKVTVTGSLHFDSDHTAGTIGPQGMRPQTSWEIHPVSSVIAV
jgi:hypothetical protein